MSITPMVFTSSAELDLDKDYRKAVHWLETLRIRRIKTLEGGYNVSHTLCWRPYTTNIICAEPRTLRFRWDGNYQEGARHICRYVDVSTTKMVVGIFGYLTQPTARHILRRTIWHPTPDPRSIMSPPRPTLPFWQHPLAALLLFQSPSPRFTTTIRSVNVRT
jgi:hypothetical protein